MSVIPGTITTNNGNAVAGSSKIRMKIDVTVGVVDPTRGSRSRSIAVANMLRCVAKSEIGLG
jgi:hypothetical protein